MAKKNNILNKIIDEVDKTLASEIPDYEKKKKKVVDTIKGKNTEEEKSSTEEIIAANDKEEIEKDNVGPKKKKFCSNCGEELDDDDKFCDSCGKEVKKKKNTYKSDKQDSDKVKTKKCPNCGALITSFQTSCKYCQAEISNIKASNSLEEFSKGLAKIKSKPMPKYEEKDSLLKKVIGRDFNDEEAREEFEEEFKRQKEEEIVNYIINYPIPNSNEDLTEFMILTSSNINVKKDLSDDVQKAWIEKMEQIYQKAKLSIKNGEELKKINDIYIAKKDEIKTKKKNTVIKTTVGVIGWFALLGLLVNPVLTIVIVLLICGIGLFIYLKSKGKITFGMNEVKEIYNKVIDFLKRLFIKIKELIKKIVEWYKKLNNNQKKKVNIGICVVIILLLLLIIVPNVISEHNDLRDYYEYEEKDASNNKDKENTTINYTIDYNNAEDFEKDLNNDKKVKGKVVIFKVNDYKPDSVLGINCWAGEHLNFISKDELDVKKGYTVIGKVTKEPTIVLGSWKIEYEVLEIKRETPVINEETNDNSKEEPKKIKLEQDSSYYIGKDSSEVKKELEKLGFINVEIKSEKTNDSKNKDNTITKVVINDKDIDISKEYNVDDKIIITCWKYEKPVSNYELAFIREMLNYDLYFMFDEDTKEVVYFGTNDSGVMKSKYSGSFSKGVDIDWERYQEGWHDAFIYKDGSTIATYIDGNGFEWEYKKCDLKQAQLVLDGLE